MHMSFDTIQKKKKKVKAELTTLSSLETEPDKFLMKWAVSLEIRNPKRAAILIPRRIRAVEKLETHISLVIYECSSLFMTGCFLRYLLPNNLIYQRPC